MNDLRRERLMTVLAWTVASVVGMALAAATTGFVGWCLGASVGDGLQSLGWTDATDSLGKTGAIMGAGIGMVTVLYTLARQQGGK